MPEELYTKKELDDHYRMAHEEGLARGLGKATEVVADMSFEGFQDGDDIRDKVAARIHQEIPNVPALANAYQVTVDALMASAHANLSHDTAKLLAARIVKELGIYPV